MCFCLKIQCLYREGSLTVKLWSTVPSLPPAQSVSNTFTFSLKHVPAFALRITRLHFSLRLVVILYWNHQQKAQKHKACGWGKLTSKRTFVYNLRAETRRQKVTLLHLSCEHWTSGNSQFPLLCAWTCTMTDWTSIVIDFLWLQRHFSKLANLRI